MRFSEDSWRTEFKKLIVRCSLSPKSILNTLSYLQSFTTASNGTRVEYQPTETFEGFPVTDLHVRLRTWELTFQRNFGVTGRIE